MTVNVFQNRIPVLGFSILLSLIAAAFNNSILHIIAVIFFLYLIYFADKDFLLLAVITILLTITGKEYASIRIFINIFSIFTIAYLFLKKYGLNFQFYPRIPHQLVYFTAFLILTLFVSSSFSNNPLIGYSALLRTTFFLVFSYFFFSLIENHRTIYLYLSSLFLVVLIVGISVFYDLSKSGFIMFTLVGDMIRQGGLYENPNYVGLILIVTIPIIISMLLERNNIKRIFKLFLMLNLIFSIALLFVSNSRASILGVLLASAVTILILNRKLFYRYFTGIVLIIILVLAIEEWGNAFSLYFRLERIGTRDQFWNAGLELFYNNPIFGVGPELFETYFFSYTPSYITNAFVSNSIWILGTPHPHNFFILLASENGVLGLLTSILIFVFFFMFALRAIKIHKNTKYFALSVALFAVGVGMLGHAFFEVTGVMTYGFIARDLPFSLIYGIIIYLNYKSMEKEISKT